LRGARPGRRRGARASCNHGDSGSSNRRPHLLVTRRNSSHAHRNARRQRGRSR
jgi:hypothetical protein